MFSQNKVNRNNMLADFQAKFAIGRRFKTRDELSSTILAFGKAHNVIFSIKDSHPSKGQFVYNCKHSGVKRSEKKESEVADIMITEKKTEDDKKPYKKSTQKLGCPAFINVYDYVVKNTEMTHNHPVSQDATIYAINRKQTPEIMQRIYSILASGHKDPVTSVMDVNTKYSLKLYLIYTLTFIYRP